VAGRWIAGLRLLGHGQRGWTLDRGPAPAGPWAVHHPGDAMSPADSSGQGRQTEDAIEKALRKQK